MFYSFDIAILVIFHALIDIELIAVEVFCFMIRSFVDLIWVQGSSFLVCQLEIEVFGFKTLDFRFVFLCHLHEDRM